MVRALAPSRAAWRGASIAILLVPLGVWVSAAFDLITPSWVWIPIVQVVGHVLFALLVAGLVILTVAILRRAPLYFCWTAVAGVILMMNAQKFMPIGQTTLWTLTAVVLPTTALTGGAVAVLLSGQWRQSGKVTRLFTAVCAFAGTGLILFGSYWLASPGGIRAEVPIIDSAPSVVAAPKSVSDPAERGPHKIKTLTYGSGTDLHRVEFGAQAQLRTLPVDGSQVLKGWNGIGGEVRTWFWGFDSSALPLNGRVWYPEDDGLFPLVLIVHGNHLAADFSDAGFAYLGELLASRGYICVSVDENFLNGMKVDLIGALRENDTRGWLLLEHLRVWHAWNEEPSNPFYRKVDTERIALVGHSRGGEAVAHAAAFNRLPCKPDHAEAKFDYGYRIRSVVAIAPADGQYRPSGALTTLTDINYLTFQGSLDRDSFSFAGLKQFDRVKFSGDGDWFKSAIYAVGANHTQFNTRWGEFDIGEGIAKRVLNTGILLDAADQRRIAMVYVSAFLDCTLRSASDRRQLFVDSRYGASWLPETAYLTQYGDSSMRLLCGFDEDVDLTTAGPPGGRIAALNLTQWREAQTPLRGGPNEDRSVVVGWNREQRAGEPTYEIIWPTGAFRLNSDSVLSFVMADGNDDPSPRDAIDLTIELTDAGGHAASLPLSHFSKLRPRVETSFYKSDWLQSGPQWEPIFQTFEFPLLDFRNANGEFDPESAVKLRLVFDRTASGVVLFDKAAFGTRR